MISSLSFEKKNIENIKAKYPKLDAQIIERTIFAFGLLEALVKVGLPFVFKGGTCMMLLLKKPYRLSTDIDIIVEPKTNIEEYLDQVAKIYPFIKKEKQTRKGKNTIVKKHYKYYYQSPTKSVELPILLDIVFEKNNYEKTIEKEIKSEFLVTMGDNLKVLVPSIESILADKLTAFAPNTTGIEFHYISKDGEKIDRSLEVIKQFLDCSMLINESSDFDVLVKTYDKIVKTEIQYRGIDASKEQCLKDAFDAALTLLTRGATNKDQYQHLISGIKKIQNHVFGFVINGETVHKHAARVVLITAKMIKNNDISTKTPQEPLANKKFKAINQIRKIDIDSFDMVAAAIRLLGLD